MRCRPVFRCMIMAAKMIGHTLPPEHASRPECAAASSTVVL